MTAHALYDLGVPIPDPDDAPRAYAECARIAGTLRPRDRHPVGFLPADRHAAAPPVAIQIAAALVDLTGAPTAFVDGQGRIPSRAWSTREGARSRAGRVRWLRRGLAVITPAVSWGARECALAAREAVREAMRDFSHVLVDLTGFEDDGELEGVAGELASAIVVAAGGRTGEGALTGAAARVAPAELCGVLVVDF